MRLQGLYEPVLARLTFIRDLLAHEELSLLLQHHHGHQHQGSHMLVKKWVVTLCPQAMRAKVLTDAVFCQALANQ